MPFNVRRVFLRGPWTGPLHRLSGRVLALDRSHVSNIPSLHRYMQEPHGQSPRASPRNLPRFPSASATSLGAHCSLFSLARLEQLLPLIRVFNTAADPVVWGPMGAASTHPLRRRRPAGRTFIGVAAGGMGSWSQVTAWLRCWGRQTDPED